MMVRARRAIFWRYTKEASGTDILYPGDQLMGATTTQTDLHAYLIWIVVYTVAPISSY